MTRILLSITALALMHFSYAQPTFQRVMGADGADIAYDQVVLDSVSGITILAGGLQDAGVENFYLAALDVDGDVIFERDWGTPGNDHLTAVELATDSTLLVAGEILDTASQAFWNIYLAEVRISDLTVRWERQYAFGQGSGVVDMVVAEDMVALAGKNNMGGHFDGLLCVLDLAGNWQYGLTFGGSSTDQLTRVALRDGKLVTCGNTLSHGPGLSAAILASVEAQSGSVLWKQVRGGAGVDWYMDLHLMENGDVLAGGYENSQGQGANDIWLSRLDSNGNLIWDRLLGGPSMDFIQTLTVDESRDLIWTSGGEDFLTCCFNLNGSYLWSNHYKLDPSELTFRDYPYSIEVVHDNSLRIVGKTKSGSAASTNHYICQVADNGYTQCNRQVVDLVPINASMQSDTTIGVASISPLWQNDPVTSDRGLVSQKELSCSTTTALEENTEDGWIVPNPVTSGRFLVEIPGTAMIQVYSVTGQLLMEKSHENITYIDVDGLEAQTLVVVLTNGEMVRRQRVIIH